MKKGTWIILGAVIIGITLILVGGRFSSGGSSNVSIPNHGGSIGASVANAQIAPDFTLANLDGGQITLSDYRGNKPVILDFWASWCPNCRRDMPKLSKWYEKYKDQVEVIGVNLREKENTVRKFISSKEILFPIALDPSSVASRAYGVQYTNFHVLINKDGTINGIVPGDMSERDIIRLIEANS